jgi:hypothetical protein
VRCHETQIVTLQWTQGPGDGSTIVTAKYVIIKHIYSEVAVHPVRPVGIKHGLLYKVLIHMEVIEDLSFSLGGGGGPGRKRRRVMEWHYGVPDHLGERRERGRQLERGNRSWRQGGDDDDEQDGHGGRRHRSRSVWDRVSRCHGSINDCYSSSHRQGEWSRTPAQYHRQHAIHHLAWGQGALMPNSKLVCRPKRLSNKKVSFAEPLVHFIEEKAAAHPSAIIKQGSVSDFCMPYLGDAVFNVPDWADPMIDEVSCGLDAADSQAAGVAKLVQVLQSTQPMEEVASPTVSTGQLSAPPPEVPSIPSLDEFLMSITRPLPDPVLGSCPVQTNQHVPQLTGAASIITTAAEESSPYPFHNLPTEDQTCNNSAQNLPLTLQTVDPSCSRQSSGALAGNPQLSSPIQRKSSRLAKKARNRVGKGALQIAEDLLVKKLNSTSDRNELSVLSELEVVEQLSQHFDRPLTKGKAEAIISLANLGTKETNKMKKSTRATVAPVDAVEFVA